MIKKLIILALVLVAAFFVYKKFIAPTSKPFFKKGTDKTDVFGITATDQKYIEEQDKY